MQLGILLGVVPCEGQVGVAVAVEVAGDESTRSRGRRRGDRVQTDRRLGTNRPVAVAQEDVHQQISPGAVPRDGEVGAAVTIEVARRKVLGQDVAKIDQIDTERPVSVAQKEIDAALSGRTVGAAQGEVGVAVAVEVAHGQRVRGEVEVVEIAQRDRNRSAKRAVALAWQQLDARPLLASRGRA